MPTANANDIRIEYDTFGEISDPTLLLIAGLGDQMIMWEEEFCGLLAANGLHVVRFDNRDVGLSSKFDEAGIPNVLEAMNASLRGERIDPPYTLEDMVDDAIGLLDSLKIEKAHICGASMGGAIAQIMAIRHPSRVSSLTSIMSSTGNPDLPEGTPEAGGILVLPMPEEKEAFIEHRLKVQKTIGSPGFPFHEEQARRKAGRVFERSFHPQGTARQHVAIVAHESIKPALASVTASTLVIHGADDPLIPLECGKDTAESVPEAELLVIDGMGHNHPKEAWPQIVEAISNHARKAQS